jgi:hypothetical protein
VNKGVSAEILMNDTRKRITALRKLILKRSNEILSAEMRAAALRAKATDLSETAALYRKDMYNMLLTLDKLRGEG